MVAGYFFGGKNPASRRTVATVSGMRAVGPALAIVASAFCRQPRRNSRVVVLHLSFVPFAVAIEWGKRLAARQPCCRGGNRTSDCRSQAWRPQTGVRVGNADERSRRTRASQPEQLNLVPVWRPFFRSWAGCPSTIGPGCASTSLPASPLWRCSCPRAWPMPNWQACRPRPSSTPRRAALLLYAIFGTSRQLVVRRLLGAGGHVVLDCIRPGAARHGRVYPAFPVPWRLRPGLCPFSPGCSTSDASPSSSRSVLVGFVGLAVVVAVKQLPKIFGIESGSGNVWERLYDLIIHLPETHLLTLDRRHQHPSPSCC